VPTAARGPLRYLSHPTMSLWVPAGESKFEMIFFGQKYQSKNG